ncbi:hypothetical protein M2110_004393, partial [Paenibacillus sp. PastF-4]|nr:hypothetical protein [Paenibacillus sp. PastF-4]
MYKVQLNEDPATLRCDLDLCQESGQSRNRHSSQLLSKTNWRKIPQRAM